MSRTALAVVGAGDAARLGPQLLVHPLRQPAHTPIHDISVSAPKLNDERTCVCKQTSEYPIQSNGVILWIHTWMQKGWVLTYALGSAFSPIAVGWVERSRFCRMCCSCSRAISCSPDTCRHRSERGKGRRGLSSSVAGVTPERADADKLESRGHDKRYHGRCAGCGLTSKCSMPRVLAWSARRVACSTMRPISWST